MTKKVKAPDAPIIYRMNMDRHDLELTFYEDYDESYFYNKAVTLMYAIKAGKAFREQLTTAPGLAPVGPRYLDSLGAELYFTAMHQCECFLALLMAPLTDKPSWIYLSEYGAGDIPKIAKLIIEGDIATLTGSRLATPQDFVYQVIYSTVTPGKGKLAERWAENLDNAWWLLRKIASYYLDGADSKSNYGAPYNAHKHGLRAITGALNVRVTPQGPDGNPVEERERVVNLVYDPTFRFLLLPEENPGEKTVHMVMKHYDPLVSFEYLVQTYSLLHTLKYTRLALIKGDKDFLENISIADFLDLNRDELLPSDTNMFAANIPI